MYTGWELLCCCLLRHICPRTPYWNGTAIVSSPRNIQHLSKLYFLSSRQSARHALRDDSTVLLHAPVAQTRCFRSAQVSSSHRALRPMSGISVRWRDRNETCLVVRFSARIRHLIKARRRLQYVPGRTTASIPHSAQGFINTLNSFRAHA